MQRDHDTSRHDDNNDTRHRARSDIPQARETRDVQRYLTALHGRADRRRPDRGLLAR